MKIKMNTSGFRKKVELFRITIEKEAEQSFAKLIKKARLAMNENIENYPGRSGNVLRDVLKKNGIAPKPGTLKNALRSSMDNGTKFISTKITFNRETVDLEKLNQLTPWGGIGGKRPIQTPNRWKPNPYPGFGFWKVYDDGFDWGDGARIFGTNFSALGKIFMLENFNREINNVIKKGLRVTHVG